MPAAYFSVVEETPLTGRYASSSATVGPWAAHLQHGGPPNALAVAAAERAVRAETGREDLVALRLASDFVGAVPVADLGTTARVIRAARSAALVEVVVSSGDRDCLLARVWFVRTADTSSVAPPLAEPVDLPDVPASDEWQFGYASSLEWRFVRGRPGGMGGAAAWVRPTLPLVEGARAVRAGPRRDGRRFGQRHLGRAGLGDLVFRQCRSRHPPGPAVPR